LQQQSFEGNCGGHGALHRAPSSMKVWQQGACRVTAIRVWSVRSIRRK
jgi:hypothetical protein